VFDGPVRHTLEHAGAVVLLTPCTPTGFRSFLWSLPPSLSHFRHRGGGGAGPGRPVTRRGSRHLPLIFFSPQQCHRQTNSSPSLARAVPVSRLSSSLLSFAFFFPSRRELPVFEAGTRFTTPVRVSGPSGAESVGAYVASNFWLFLFLALRNPFPSSLFFSDGS